MVPTRLAPLALCALVALAFPVSAFADGAPRPLASWELGFTTWIDETLGRPELEAAVAALGSAEADASVLDVLDKLIGDRVREQTRDVAIPPEAASDPIVREVRGAVIAAAREFAAGNSAGALALLDDPALANDAGAIHLRALLIDETTRDGGTQQRLAAIEEYRRALRLAPDAPAAARARLRIGQIFFRVGWIAEARAALARLVGEAPEAAILTPARITLAEAAFRDRKYELAIEQLQALESAELPSRSRHWRLERLGDAQFQLRRYTDARDTYRLLAANDHFDITHDSVMGLRIAFVELEAGDASAALDVIESFVGAHVPAPTRKLALLLLARTARTLELHSQEWDAASTAISTGRQDELSALAVVEALEAARLQGQGDLRIPPGGAAIIARAYQVASPDFALLAYRASLVPGPGDTPEGVRAQLATMYTGLRSIEGAHDVRAMIGAALVRSSMRAIIDAVEGGLPVPADVIEILSSRIETRALDDDGVLFTAEAFYREGRSEDCARWARALRAREVRPVRWGFGAWREALCQTFGAKSRATPKRMLAQAASGEAGSYSLALSALAGERLLQLGDLDAAIDAYASGLAAIAEPRLVGPISLRYGELLASAGREALAVRYLLRGLARTGDEERVHASMRRRAILILADLAPKHGRRKELATILESERAREHESGAGDAEWWNDVYAYLEYREGLGHRPEGDDVFARGAAEIDRVEALSERAKRLLPPAVSAPKSGEGP